MKFRIVIIEFFAAESDAKRRYKNSRQFFKCIENFFPKYLIKKLKPHKKSLLRRKLKYQTGMSCY